MSAGKKLLSVILAIAVLIIALPIADISSFASDASDFTYQVISETNKTAEIISYTGSGGDVVIPSVIDGYTVVSIGDTAFGDEPDTSINTLTIPSSVNSISPMSIAFLFACSSFIVENGNSDYSSVDGVLYNSDKTELVRFPCIYGSESFTVPDSAMVLGFASFAFCSLSEINLPYGLKTITDFAFAYSPELEQIVIPNSVLYIGEDAFDSCTSLKTAVLSDSLTVVSAYLFSGCVSLTEVTVPSSVESIEAGAFENTDLKAIFCQPGSYADGYATDNEYISIDINASKLPGDMNNDFISNDQDLETMLLISVGKSDPTFMQTRLGDINGDGVVDGFDIAELDRNIH